MDNVENHIDQNHLSTLSDDDELGSEYKEITKDYFKEVRKRREELLKKKKKLKSKNKQSKDAASDEDEPVPEDTLKDGEVLPQYYGKCPDHLLGRPLEDLDPFYKENGEETFCVVTERFSSMYIYRLSASPSWFIFSPFNPLRRFAVRVSVNQFFDYFVMLTIVVNCVFLALDNEITQSEYVFTAIYTTEMLIKMLARGVVLSKFTYLRDGWNWLDFLVVILAWVTIIITAVSTSNGSGWNLSGLRTFRVIRAFKSFTIVPGLKTIVNALLQSLKPLAEVMVIMLFLVVVISLIALQAYQGVLHRRCVRIPNGGFNFSTESEYEAYVNNQDNHNPVSGELIVCGNASLSGLCPDGYLCLQDVGGNPNFGYTNFDHFGYAMLTSFQLLTLDFWENVYNMIIRAEGAWNVLFFFISVILGPFYLLNLLLAVVTLAYSKEHDKQTKLLEMRERAKESSRRRNKRRRILAEIRERRRREAEDILSFSDAAEQAVLSVRRRNRELSQNSISHSLEQPGTSELIESSNDIAEDISVKHVPVIVKSGASENDKKLDLTKSLENHSQSEDTKESKRRKFRSSHKNISLDSSESASSTQPEWKKWIEKRYNSFHATCCSWSCHPKFVAFQEKLKIVVEHKVFEGFVVLSILTNTVFLALDHHEIDSTFERVLNDGNYVFTGIFAVEALLKIIALSPLGYIKNPWNVFDFIIVIVSLVELGLQDFAGALSVLRSLRLMRVFRLARIWTTMRKLMSIILKSLSAVVYLTIVLFMVLFIFAVVGKQLYGQSYKTNGPLKWEDGIGPRWHFQDFYHSFFLVWRVLCGEWIEPLHDCMHLVDASCIPLFLLMTFLGNFLVLNLFTAILLEAFNVDNLKSKQVDQKTAKLKLGVERFRKLLKKSQHRSKSTEESTSSDKNETDGINNGNKEDSASSSPTSQHQLEAKAQTPRRSMSAADIFTLHQASQKRNRSPDSRLNGSPPGTRVPDVMVTSNSIESNQHPGISSSRQRTLKKQSRISDETSSVTNRDVGIIPMTIQEVEESEENDVNAIETNVENDITTNTLPKKVTFVVSGNSKVYPKQHTNSSISNKDGDGLTTKSYHVPWYKKCCASYCGSENNNDVQSVIAAEDGDSPLATEEQNPEEQPKEAPACFPKWCQCCPSCEDTESYNRWKRFRTFIFGVVEHQIFEWFILFIILGSTVSLAMEDVYLEENTVKADVLKILEYVFTCIFTAEMLLKWIGIGFYKYFTNWWCIIDFVIVVISWIGIGASSVVDVDSLKALRTLRALRPLRAISRWQGMRVVVNALVYCIPSIANVLCVCMLLWLVFSIIGVQQFKGRFYRCEDMDGNVLNHTIVQNKTVCEQNSTYVWRTPRINFDNVLNGMIALFQVATFEGWIEIMADASDTVEVDQQPYREANPFSYIFFFVFVLIGSFFILNLIVGVIIESFQKLRKQTESSSAVEAFLTESQKNFYKTMRTMLNRKPKKTIPPPENPTQLKIFKLVTHSKFEVAVFSVIVLNMITLAMEHYKMTNTWVTVLRYVDISFTVAFSLEAALKIAGTRFYYFRDPFNVFDFVVVILSITGFILEELLTFLVSPTLLRVVRVFRVFRVLRVIRAARGIRRLILTLMISLPALFNIAVLLGVFMVIFAILGMSYFMDVKLRGALNDIVNFRTFGNSMMLLFRLMTSAGWNDVLDPLMNDSDCDPNKDCGKYHFAIIYFVSYIFLVFLVIVNMYIAIILENFDEIFQQEETGVGQDDFEYFYVVWGRYDPKASQFVSIAELSNLLHSLHPPFQLAKPNEVKIAALNLPIVNGDKVHCLDVLFALVKRIMGEVEISDQMREEAEARLLKSFPNRKTLKAETTTLALRRKVKAAKVIQDAWRQFHRGRKRRGTDASSSEIFSPDLSLSPISAEYKGFVKDEIKRLPSINEVSQVLANERPNQDPGTSDLSSQDETYANRADHDTTKVESVDEKAESMQDVTSRSSQFNVKNEVIADADVVEQSVQSKKSTQNGGKNLATTSESDENYHDSPENILNNNGIETSLLDEVDEILYSPPEKHRVLENSPSPSLHVIRNENFFNEPEKSDPVIYKSSELTDDHEQKVSSVPALKKQMNVEKHESAKNAPVSKVDSVDSNERQSSRLRRPPNLKKSNVVISTEDQTKMNVLQNDARANISKPITGKNLKFNPQTGKFKAKTRTDDVELVSMPRSMSATNAIGVQQIDGKVDQSLVITNSNIGEENHQRLAEI